MTLASMETEIATLGIQVEVSQPDSPFGGVQVLGIAATPTQVVINQGIAGPQGPTGPEGPAGQDATAIITNTAIYRLSSATSQSDPGSGKMKFNSSTAGAPLTAIYLSSLTNSNLDVSSMVAMIENGDIILVQDQNNAANAIRLAVNAAVVNNGGWWTIPVIFVASQGTMPNNNDTVAVVLMMK